MFTKIITGIKLGKILDVNRRRDDDAMKPLTEEESGSGYLAFRHLTLLIILLV